jgi:hypothetical protein
MNYSRVWGNPLSNKLKAWTSKSSGTTRLKLYPIGHIIAQTAVADVVGKDNIFIDKIIDRTSYGNLVVQSGFQMF